MELEGIKFIPATFLKIAFLFFFFSLCVTLPHSELSPLQAQSWACTPWFVTPPLTSGFSDPLSDPRLQPLRRLRRADNAPCWHSTQFLYTQCIFSCLHQLRNVRTDLKKKKSPPTENWFGRFKAGNWKEKNVREENLWMHSIQLASDIKFQRNWEWLW